MDNKGGGRDANRFLYIHHGWNTRRLCSRRDAVIESAPYPVPIARVSEIRRTTYLLSRRDFTSLWWNL